MTGTINLGDEWEITADETVDDLVIRHKPTDNSFALGADGTFTPLPELAITSVDTVPDKAARLSVSAEEGDIVIQTDVSKTFVLTTNDPTVNSNWVEIQIDVLNTIDGQQITPSQVGTSTNRTDVVADNIEANTIGSQSTSDRPDLIADDVGPRSVADDYLYAGEFSGGSPDSRLSSCLNAASGGDVIQLENAKYAQSVTVSKAVKLVGTNAGSRFAGTNIDGATWTISDRVDIDSVAFLGGTTLQLNNQKSAATNIQARTSATINIGANNVRLIGGHALDVTVNADNCVVFGLTKSTVTDNGSGNQVGFIS